MLEKPQGRIVLSRKPGSHKVLAAGQGHPSSYRARRPGQHVHTKGRPHTVLALRDPRPRPGAEPWRVARRPPLPHHGPAHGGGARGACLLGQQGRVLVVLTLAWRELLLPAQSCLVAHTWLLARRLPLQVVGPLVARTAASVTLSMVGCVHGLHAPARHHPAGPQILSTTRREGTLPFLCGRRRCTVVVDSADW